MFVSTADAKLRLEMSSSLQHIIYGVITLYVCVCVCACSFSPQGCSSPKVTWVWGPSWVQLSSTSCASSACVASSPDRYGATAAEPAADLMPFSQSTTSSLMSASNIQPHEHKVGQSTHACMHMFMQKNAGHTNTLLMSACMIPCV